jgi:hypothetical protein
MRTTIPLILTFIVGVFMVGEFFIPHWRYHMYTSWVLEWGLLIAAGAYLLGLINLVQVNLPKVLSREEDWGYRAVMLVSMLLTMVVGFYGGEGRLDEGQGYRWIYDFVFIPLSSTMFALLAFYIASAAFRAFRARNLDATVLLGAACLVMIARVPIGEAIGSFLSTLSFGLLPDAWLSQLMNWIMDVPNTAARRAIFIGAALGAVATGLRIILGIERSHLGSD